MKLGTVIKLDKRNVAASKKIYDDVISVICDFNVFFPIYRQSAAIWKPDSGRLVYKTYIFINKNLLSYKN